MQIARQSPDAALAALDSTIGGLSGVEAARRLSEFGPNRVAAVARTPRWLILLGEFTHFFALILWLAALLAFAAAYLEPGQGMLELGMAIVGVIVVNGVLLLLAGLSRRAGAGRPGELLPQRVEVRRDGRQMVVEADQLVPGDILLLAEGGQGAGRLPPDRELGLARQSGHADRGNLPKGPQRGCRAGCGARSAGRPLPAAGRHADRFRRGQRGGLRHRHAHRIRPHRPPDADRRRNRIAAAGRDPPRFPPGGAARPRPRRHILRASARRSACRSGPT